MSITYSPVVPFQLLEVQLRYLDVNSEEYKFVAKKFNTGVSNPIKKIQVVYNKSVWMKYNKNLENSLLNEIFVFHGTRANEPKLIYTNGLLVEKTVAGLYFAQSSATSNGFAHSSGSCNQIFMCRLLVPNHQVLSGVHVIKNNDHHYPQYLISY
ncbi:hypothetical protein ACTFIY_008508 [Dictyostelium cf. discoideum]